MKYGKYWIFFYFILLSITIFASTSENFFAKALGPYRTKDCQFYEISNIISRTQKYYLEDKSCVTNYFRSLDFLLISSTATLKEVIIFYKEKKKTLAYHFTFIRDDGRDYTSSINCQLSKRGKELVENNWSTKNIIAKVAFETK